MDKDFLDRFQKIRSEWYRISGKDLIKSISSGYRCPSHNRRVSKYASKIDGSGPHTKGKAVDIKVSGKDATRLFRIAKKHMSGIGYNLKGRNRSHFLHVDSLTPEEADRPAVWSYR